MSPPDPEAKKALEVAATAAGLNVAGMSLDTLFWQTTFGMAPPWHLVSLAVSILMLIYFPLRRTRPPPAWLSASAFVLNNVVIATALWFADSKLAGYPPQSATFQPQKLGALAVAILAPPSVYAAVLSIVIFAGSAIVRYELFDPEIKARLASEPWAIVAYGMFGLGLYLYRIQSRKMRSEVHRVQAEAASLERLSCVLLAFRDFFNTPLQTLELTIAILKVRHPDDAPLVARMERATGRLAELNRIASTYETPVCGVHPVSMDAAEILAQRGRGN